MALGTGLRAAEVADDWAPALAAIRFLAVTGWRSGEALTLRSSEVALARHTAKLARTKTGASTCPVGASLRHPADHEPWRARVPGAGRQHADNQICRCGGVWCTAWAGCPRT